MQDAKEEVRQEMIRYHEFLASTFDSCAEFPIIDTPAYRRECRRRAKQERAKADALCKRGHA